MTDENNNSNNLALFADDRFEPCRVCGEPSSGWHCGAVTCEACKKFFLRSINGEDAKYKCLRNQDCVIVRTTRTQCQYCRFQKCKEVGMTINENPSNPTVAELFKGFACSVCKAPSSGVHFGAITCEGCKGFFRRSIKERAPERYRCMEAGNCEISVATRNMCRHCRFQRCLFSGMSAQNSRIGRQSNLFKHHIIEWQSKGLTPNSGYLINQRKIKRNKSDAGFVTNSNSNSNSNSSVMATSTIITTSQSYEPIVMNQMQPIQNLNNCVNNINNINTINTSNMNINIINQQQIIQNNHYAHNPNEFIPMNQTTDMYSTNNMMDPSMSQNYPMAVNSYNTMPAASNLNQNSYYSWASNGVPNVVPAVMNTNPINLIATNNNQMIESNNRIMLQQAKPHQVNTVCIEDSLEDEVKHLIKVIHQSYTHYLSSIVECMNTEFAKNTMFNNNLNYSNYHHHQQQQHQQHLNGSFIEIMKYLNFYWRKIFSFSQNIPGLSKLSNEDKDELVRCSIHSVVLLSMQRKCNYFNYFNGDGSKLEKLIKCLPKFVITSQFMKTIHDKFDKFKLDDKEYGLYTALLVVSTASNNLKEYDKIMEVREDIGSALRKYMFARRNEEITCDEILLMLAQFRKSNNLLRDSMSVFHEKITETWPDAFKDYPFFYRVFMPIKSLSL